MKIKKTSLYWILKFINSLTKLFPLFFKGDQNNGNNKTILLFTSLSIFSDHLLIEELVAKFLRKKSNKVFIVLCDKKMELCHSSDRYSFANHLTTQKKTEEKQNQICNSCISTKLVFEKFIDHNVLNYSEGVDYFNSKKFEVSKELKEYIESGSIRFAATSEKSELKKLPEWIHKKYHSAAISSYKASYGLIKKYNPDIVIAHHGIYVPQGVVQFVSNILKKTFYSWHFGYRKQTLIFSKGNTYHKEMVDVTNKQFDISFDKKKINKIMNYLFSRQTGKNDWIYFNRNAIDLNLEDFNLKNDGNIFTFYTSVDWDAALHFPSSLYKNQFEFIKDLVDTFKNFNNLNLIIRIHPAEITGSNPAFVSSEKYIKSLNPSSNIKIIPAHSKISSYDLAKISKAVIVYNTKLGIELPPFGIPVIVGGDCWIKNKGFSFDLSYETPISYYLENINKLKLDTSQIKLAQKFAYYFYFMRCIDCPELVSDGNKFQIKLKKNFNDFSGHGFDLITSKIINEIDVVISD
tara:strand:+ start:8355 stop:9911 length:1557 start_codon:yes stop_codon:yes gene_type:complete